MHTPLQTVDYAVTAHLSAMFTSVLPAGVPLELPCAARCLMFELSFCWAYRWCTQHKWPGAARQALHHLSFLEADPRFCCCWGLDFEVLCGRWDKPLGVASGARPFPTNADEDGVPQPLPAGAARVLNMTCG